MDIGDKKLILSVQLEEHVVLWLSCQTQRLSCLENAEMASSPFNNGYLYDSVSVAAKYLNASIQELTESTELDFR